MENLFELIVFFITAVIFIVSAITKQKKKPNQQSEVSGMDNLVESFFGISEDIPTQAQAQTYNTDVEPVKEPEKLKKEMIVKSKDGARNTEMAIDEEETEQNIDFDLRKAVIYSEILNRKHF